MKLKTFELAVLYKKEGMIMSVGVEQDYYKVMVEESFDGIFIQKGPKIWLANRPLHEMLGYTPYELIGKDHWIIYAPEYQSLTRERAQRRMRGEDVPSRYNVKLQRKDGSWIYGEINAKRVVVEGEIGVLVWIKDIHQQVLTLRALEESEQKFKSAFEHAAIGIAITDLKGNILDCNEFFAHYLSYKKDELKGVYVKGITYDEDWLTDSEVHRSLISGLVQNVVIEKRFLTKNKTIVWGRVSSSLVRDTNNVPLYIVSHIQDITREKRAIDSLKEKEAFISAILNALPEPVIVYQEGMLPVYTNPAFHTVFGWAREEFLKDPTIYLPAGQDVLTDKDVIDHLVIQMGSYLETTRKTKDGRILDVMITAAYMSQDPFKGYLIVIKDVTRANEIRQRIESLQRLESLGFLAGGIAHDFNNLLTGIIGRTSIMKTFGGLAPEFKTYIQEIERCAMEASNLTKQLLTYAKGEQLELTELNINELIEDVIQLFSRTKKDITIVKLLDPKVNLVKADRTQIRQVILNLFLNAADAMEAGGQVFVESENVILDKRYLEPYKLEPGPYVKIAITDTGTGMTEEVKRRIFEPFFSTKELGRGTGMGLAMVYSIIKSHKGIINCYSELGKGTTFTIYLPSTGGNLDLAVSQAPEFEEVLRGEGTILVVDDEQFVLDIARDLLEHLGYEVVCTNSGKESVEIFREMHSKFDLVILDVIMPEMSGKEVFIKIRQINPKQKVLFASGYSLNGLMQDFLRQEDIGFIQKPFNLNELSKKVKEMLNRDV